MQVSIQAGDAPACNFSGEDKSGVLIMVLAVYCVAVLHRLPAPVFRHFVDSAEEESRTSEEPCEPHYRAFDDSESEDCGLEIRRARRSVTALARSKHRGETVLVDVYGYEEQFPDCFSHGTHVTEMYGLNQGRHVHAIKRNATCRLPAGGISGH